MSWTTTGLSSPGLSSGGQASKCTSEAEVLFDQQRRSLGDESPIACAITAHHRTGLAGEAVELPRLDFIMDAGIVDQNEVRFERRALAPAVERFEAVLQHFFKVRVFARHLDVDEVAERSLQAVVQIAFDAVAKHGA